MEGGNSRVSAPAIGLDEGIGRRAWVSMSCLYRRAGKRSHQMQTTPCSQRQRAARTSSNCAGVAEAARASPSTSLAQHAPRSARASLSTRLAASKPLGIDLTAHRDSLQHAMCRRIGHSQGRTAGPRTPSQDTAPPATATSKIPQGTAAAEARDGQAPPVSLRASPRNRTRARTAPP